MNCTVCGLATENGTTGTKYCPVCVKVRTGQAKAIYRENNRERLKEIARMYRQRVREAMFPRDMECSGCGKLFVVNNNRRKICEDCLLERRRERIREWKLKNPEKRRLQKERERQRKKLKESF